MRRIAIALLLCFGAIAAHAQNCSPFMGISTVQFLGNDGTPLTNGALYAYQGGTSVQQATFSDPACTVTNVNPLTFGTGARATIWLTTSAIYKFVLCSSSSDGPSCAAGDTLAVADLVPGGATSSGGGGGAPFITNSANPATSGILRLASGDTICWRNQANSANLCFKKNTNDLLSWDGGSFLLPEVAAPTSLTGFDILYADSTAHRYKQCPNGAGCAQLVVASSQINTSDQVVGLQFGSTPTPLSGTAPTTSQLLQWNGTNIIGTNLDLLFIWCPAGNGLCIPSSAFNETTLASFGAEVLFPLAHTIKRFTYNLAQSPAGCATSPVIGIRDMTSSTNLQTSTITNGATIGFVDSGVISVATTAGDKIMVGVITGEAGCGTNALISNLVAVYQ